MDHFDFKKFVKTRITIRHLDPNGKVLGERVGQNTFTNAAADILMGALLGSDTRRVSWLYARYSTDHDIGVAVNGAIPLVDLTRTTRATFLQTGAIGTQTGTLWVPKRAVPLQMASSADFNGNTATFLFRIPLAISGESQYGSAFSSASYIGGLGLAVADSLHPDDRTLDVIFSAVNYDAFTAQGAGGVPIQAPMGAGQIAVDYTISFAPPTS